MSAGTKKSANTRRQPLSASERRSLNPFIGHGFEELVNILKAPVPHDHENDHKFAMHAILIRFPGQDIQVMDRANSMSTNSHEQDAICLAREFVISAREKNPSFHSDNLLSRHVD